MSPRALCVECTSHHLPPCGASLADYSCLQSRLPTHLLNCWNEATCRWDVTGGVHQVSEEGEMVLHSSKALGLLWSLSVVTFKSFTMTHKEYICFMTQSIEKHTHTHMEKHTICSNFMLNWKALQYIWKSYFRKENGIELLKSCVSMNIGVLCWDYTNFLNLWYWCTFKICFAV